MVCKFFCSILTYIEFGIEKEILKARNDVYVKYGVDAAEVDTALNVTYAKDRYYTIL